jgi:hypothetical protein
MARKGQSSLTAHRIRRWWDDPKLRAGGGVGGIGRRRIVHDVKNVIVNLCCVKRK